MKTYKNSYNQYVLEADEGKMLYNPKTHEYTKMLISVRGVTMTDWIEVDESQAVDPLATKTDEELLSEFSEQILASVSIVRGTKKMTSTSVSYSYDSATNTITELYS